MDLWQTIINIVGGAALSAIGWFFIQGWDYMRSIAEKVHDIEVDLPKNYVRQDQIKDQLDKIDARFDKLDVYISKLFDKIDSYESHRRG
jgi:hypothetical protein